MKAKCLFLFALLMTLTGSYKGEVKAASNFDVTTELLAFERNVTPPFFTKKPQDIIAVEGETVKITAKITGSQPITIKVYKDNVELKFSGRISL